MSTASYKKAIVSAIAHVLTRAGFRKSGASFVRTPGDVVQLVSLQSSQSSTSTVLRITVNLAVWVPALADGRDKPDVSASQWRERIGLLMPIRNDRWWEVASESAAAIAAVEIADALRDFGLPALDRVASIAALRTLWEEGSCPGLTDILRRRYLERLTAVEKKG